MILKIVIKLFLLQEQKKFSLMIVLLKIQIKFRLKFYIKLQTISNIIFPILSLLEAMTNSNFEDRPLNPNKQYLQQKQTQFKQRKLISSYLKKHQLNDRVLPCFRASLKNFQKIKQYTPSNRKTKSQIYQEIKKKNEDVFGVKDQKIKKQQKTLKQVIKPSKMTINYKPKKSVFIDTDNYRQSPTEHFFQKENHAKNLSFSQVKTQQQVAKQKYQKLLGIIGKERVQLLKEKQDFQKYKQKLNFKTMIQTQNGLPFENQIKKAIQQKNSMIKRHGELGKIKKQNTPSQSNHFKQQKYHSKYQEMTFNQDLDQIQSRIIQFEQQKHEIQSQVYLKKKNRSNFNETTDAKYTIDQVNQIPAFDIENFKKFINLKTLHPHHDQSYQTALQVFQNGLTIKQAKMKLKVDNLDFTRQEGQRNLNSLDFKRRFQGKIRITKYNNGWVQVWNPGVQRLMANKSTGYKVVWLKNGDIHQEWKSKGLDSYYSKNKQVVRLKFNKNQPIYFFTQLNQIEQYDSFHKNKTVMLKQGRIQTFSIQKSTMNAFSI